MINHVRTLLLNRGRDGHGLDEYGEEYIPSTYAVRSLTTTMQTIQRRLFGGSPDRLFINYRMRQLMQLMHSTPLENDLYVDDPRITYLPFDDDLFNDAFGVTLNIMQKSTGTATAPSIYVNVVGTPDFSEQIGVTKYLWEWIRTGTVDDFTVTATRRIPQPTESIVYAGTDPAEPVVLPGSAIKVFTQFVPDEFEQMEIHATARPDTDIGETLQAINEALGTGGLAEIFRPNDPEPFKTWYKIYNEEPTAAMKWTALLLAIAKRIEQRPVEVT